MTYTDTDTKNTEYARKHNRIVVVGTGSQAPYGIGEIITTYAPTDAGLKKAEKFAAEYYNEPRIIDPREEF